MRHISGKRHSGVNCLFNIDNWCKGHTVVYHSVYYLPVICPLVFVDNRLQCCCCCCCSSYCCVSFISTLIVCHYQGDPVRAPHLDLCWKLAVMIRCWWMGLKLTETDVADAHTHTHTRGRMWVCKRVSVCSKWELSSLIILHNKCEKRVFKPARLWGFYQREEMVFIRNKMCVNERIENIFIALLKLHHK